MIRVLLLTWRVKLETLRICFSTMHMTYLLSRQTCVFVAFVRFFFHIVVKAGDGIENVRYNHGPLRELMGRGGDPLNKALLRAYSWLMQG